VQIIVIEADVGCAPGKESECAARVRDALDEARRTGEPAVLALPPGRRLFVVEVEGAKATPARQAHHPDPKKIAEPRMAVKAS
jgi:hypothetical protein